LRTVAGDLPSSPGDAFIRQAFGRHGRYQPLGRGQALHGSLSATLFVILVLLSVGGMPVACLQG